MLVLSFNPFPALRMRVFECVVFFLGTARSIESQRPRPRQVEMIETAPENVRSGCETAFKDNRGAMRATEAMT